MNPNLSQLRDIHLPPTVSWWPPAPGWWMLLALLLLLIIAALVMHRHHHNSRWRNEALREVTHIRNSAAAGELSDSEVAERLSNLLRQVALSRFPRSSVASLVGEAWLSFLDTQGDAGGDFVAGPGRLLLDAPYRRESQFDTTLLIDLCERWISHHHVKQEASDV